MNKTSELKSCAVFLQDKVIGEVIPTVTILP